MNPPKATTYRVEAYNLSHASENKIHDDAVAQKLGFAGGLVPGVEVYAYACHPAVQRWGRAWLERGQMECRFLKPVYDGRIAAVTGKDTAAGLDLELRSEGVLCATGRAWLSDGALSRADIEAPKRVVSQFQSSLFHGQRGEGSHERAPFDAAGQKGKKDSCRTASMPGERQPQVLARHGRAEIVQRSRLDFGSV